MLAYLMTTADDIIRQLNLIPHPEGGHYRQTFLDPQRIDGRPVSSAIYYLLAAGERSHWHRVDAVEIWHWHAGEPLELRIHEAGVTQTLKLGPDIAGGEAPQLVVPMGAWQAARPLGAWALVGCTVAPAFQFSGFEMAPPGWEP